MFSQMFACSQVGGGGVSLPSHNVMGQANSRQKADGWVPHPQKPDHPHPQKAVPSRKTDPLSPEGRPPAP